MVTVPLSMIRPSPNPIRKTWDEDKMKELAASIKERGVIVPIKVRPDLPGYEIVYGHRRVEAARRAGLEDIPAIVEKVDDTDALIEALIENVQREDMKPYEQALALAELKQRTGWINKQIAQSVGWQDETPVSRLLDWLRPELEPIKELVHVQVTDGALLTFAKAGLGRDNATGLPHIIEKAITQDLTRAETRATAEAYARADTPELKEAVLQTSGKLGDADRILQVAQMNIGAAGLVERHEAERRQAFEEYDRAVKDFLDFMRLSEKVVKTARSAAQYGKFSAEGAQFAVGRIDRLIAELEILREELGRVN